MYKSFGNLKQENQLLHIALQEIMRTCAENLSVNELAAEVHAYCVNAKVLVNQMYEKKKNNEESKTARVPK